MFGGKDEKRATEDVDVLLVANLSTTESHFRIFHWHDFEVNLHGNFLPHIVGTFAPSLKNTWLNDRYQLSLFIYPLIIR